MWELAVASCFLDDALQEMILLKDNCNNTYYITYLHIYLHSRLPPFFKVATCCYSFLKILFNDAEAFLDFFHMHPPP